MYSIHIKIKLTKWTPYTKLINPWISECAVSTTESSSATVLNATGTLSLTQHDLSILSHV